MKIIFFGDSITDAARDRSDPAALGDGYVKIAADKLRLLYPETGFEILNRGCGGEKTKELLARIEKDVIAEDPDVVVLEVGINDVWHRFLGGEVVTAEEFRKNYEKLVKLLKGTHAKIILLQPYALRVGDKQRFRPYVDAFNTIIQEIAVRENLPVIPLDEIFRGVTQDIDPALFAADGVHPTHRGCRYIADLVIKELKKYL